MRRPGRVVVVYRCGAVPLPVTRRSRPSASTSCCCPDAEIDRTSRENGARCNILMYLYNFRASNGEKNARGKRKHPSLRGELPKIIDAVYRFTVRPRAVL